MTRRDAILADIADFILARGLDAGTLRAMAMAAGESDRMLLYYFRDKEEIVAAVLQLLSERLLQVLATLGSDRKLRKEALHAQLDAVVLSEELWPFLSLWLDLAARAARGDGFFAPMAQGLSVAFHQWIEGQLATTDPDLRRKEATEIMIGLEGIVVMKAVGMQRLVDELL